MSETILVTGGNGFLGRHVVAQLRQQGRQVRSLSRTPDPQVRELGAETVAGSVLDGPALREASRGCTAVLHLAGRVSRDPRDAAELHQLHVEGTQRVLEAAATAGIQRIVYASTSGTIACSRDPHFVADETAPYPDALTRGWPYYVSKIAAERLALTMAPQLGLELICLNPSILFGPGDERLSSTEDVLRILRSQVPAIPSGGLNFVDVRDVAAACVAALENGRPGERYLLGAVNWSLAEFIRRVGKLAGCRTPSLPAPDLPTRWAAHATAAIWRSFGKTPPLDPVSIEMSQVFWYFDSGKAKAELGFSPREAEATLTDTIADWRQRHPQR